MKLPEVGLATTSTYRTGERKFKCGLIPGKRKFRAARLADHVTAKLPAPSPELDLYSAVDFYGMDGNDRYGDCGFAGASHTHNTWTANVGGKTVHFDLNKLISDYIACAGGDNGVTEDQLVSYWKNIGICGTKIVGDCEVNKDDPIELRQGLEIFGNLQIGVLLAEQWTEDDIFWDANAGRPGYFMGAQGDAGHWIVAVGTKIVNGRLWFVVVTWGGLKYMSPEAISQYAMFTNVALSEAWVNQATAKSPTGVDVAGLIADMDLLNGPDPAPVWPGPIPVPPSPAPVSPPPTPAPTPTPTPTNQTQFAELTWGSYTPAAQKTLNAAGLNGLHITIGVGAPNPVQSSNPVEMRFQSWILSGLDSISAIAKTARYLAQTYGPDAYAVFNATADLAINRDIESALKLKTAIDQLVSDIQGRGTPTSIKFGFGPSDVIGWIQLAQLVADLIRSIRGKNTPTPAPVSVPGGVTYFPTQNGNLYMTF